jgi:predicted aldo/keto reductase-like oxidoreductase
MQFRTLGRTELKVSEIGYGAEHLVDKPYEVVDAVINTALDGGVNIIDVFMPQAEIRSNIGKAIGKRRKDVMLQGHIGATLQSDGQYLRSRDPEHCDIFAKDFMTRFNTDYIDLGMVHFVDTDEDFKEAFDSPYIEYVQKLKRDGIIRFIGTSTHDAATGIKIVNTGLIDMVMFSINPAFDFAPETYDLDMLFRGDKLDKLKIDPVRAEFYNLCAAKGVGITVMKTLGAGRLLNAESSAFGKAMTLPQCVSYSLDRPAVSSVLLGAQTVEEMKQGLDYEHSTAEERNYTWIIQSGLPLLGGKCMYCNHCLPCPQGIDIAAVTKYLDIAKINGSDTIRAHYNALSAHGSDCIECGNCEKECPFDIKVVENMREAMRVFGK